MKVVWKDDIHLLVKGKFKRMTECDKFDKFVKCFCEFGSKIKKLE